MKTSLQILLFVALFLLLVPQAVTAQTVDSVATGGDEVVELGATEIKVKIETPQVKLFSKRIKPEFDDVHLEKSFIKEITGAGEGFELKNVLPVAGETRIDINKVLQKLR